MVKQKLAFKFGDKVHDWVDNENYIILKKTRGHFYHIVDSKQNLYKIGDLRLKRGWKGRVKDG